MPSTKGWTKVEYEDDDVRDERLSQPTPPEQAVEVVPGQFNFRDRVIEMKKMKVQEILANDDNWRMHPEAQNKAMTGILNQIGIAGALLAYYSERNGGQLTFIDGHERKEITETKSPNTKWPVIITDLDDEEADLLLAVYDPLSAMAEENGSLHQKLLARVAPGVNNLDVREMLRKLSRGAEAAIELAKNTGSAADTMLEQLGPPDMGLLPFEHYDYIVLLFTKYMDWLQAMEVFGLQKVADPRVSKQAKNPVIGLGRAIDGARVLKLISEARGDSPNLGRKAAAKMARQQLAEPEVEAEKSDGWQPDIGLSADELTPEDAFEPGYPVWEANADFGGGEEEEESQEDDF
jgi:hypothetical protein